MSRREPLLKKMKSMPGEFRCPTCGRTLSPNARSCGGCGAEREGSEWLAPEAYDGLQFGDDEFDYDEFVKEEFGKEGPMPKGIRWYWWLIAIALLAGIVALGLR